MAVTLPRAANSRAALLPTFLQRNAALSALAQLLRRVRCSRTERSGAIDPSCYPFVRSH